MLHFTSLIVSRMLRCSKEREGTYVIFESSCEPRVNCDFMESVLFVGI